MNFFLIPIQLFIIMNVLEKFWLMLCFIFSPSASVIMITHFVFIKNYLKRCTLDRETPIHISADENVKNIDIPTY